ncbi:hypothetical protein TYRP_001487 [Tyrophagus putrescentiae]|nr:hypothetical protein TYRP_001487 [Tyrophagus putrescentiae]
MHLHFLHVSADPEQGSDYFQEENDIKTTTPFVYPTSDKPEIPSPSLPGCTNPELLLKTSCYSSKVIDENTNSVDTFCGQLYERFICSVLIACLHCGTYTSKVVTFDRGVRANLSNLLKEYQCGKSGAENNNFTPPHSLQRPICAWSSGDEHEDDIFSYLQKVLIISVIAVSVLGLLFIIFYFCWCCCWRRRKAGPKGHGQKSAQAESSSALHKAEAEEEEADLLKSPKTDPGPKMGGVHSSLKDEDEQQQDPSGGGGVVGGNYPHMSKLPSKVSAKLQTLLADGGRSRIVPSTTKQKHHPHHLKAKTTRSGSGILLGAELAPNEGVDGVGGGKSKTRLKVDVAQNDELLNGSDLVPTTPSKAALKGSAAVPGGKKKHSKGAGVSKKAKSRKPRRSDSKTRHHKSRGSRQSKGKSKKSKGGHHHRKKRTASKGGGGRRSAAIARQHSKRKSRL